MASARAIIKTQHEIPNFMQEYPWKIGTLNLIKEVNCQVELIFKNSIKFITLEHQNIPLYTLPRSNCAHRILHVQVGMTKQIQMIQ